MTERYAANKGIAASRAVVIFGCSLLSASVWAANTFGLLFVIFYFYIFIQQRLGADTAINSLPFAPVGQG